VRLFLVGLVLLAFAAPVRAAVAVPDTTAISTVILVRHAEKNEHPPGGDKGLATKGLIRAKELARVLEGSRVHAVYVSQYGRARMTGEPLAAAIGDSVHTYDANHLDALATRVRAEAKGSTVLIVGHGDTIQPTIEQLIGTVLGANEAAPYDRMWILTLGPGDAWKLVRLRYGAPAD
jgi:phosphohistidine phosphatase SixA